MSQEKLQTIIMLFFSGGRGVKEMSRKTQTSKISDRKERRFGDIVTPFSSSNAV